MRTNFERESNSSASSGNTNVLYYLFINGLYRYRTYPHWASTSCSSKYELTALNKVINIFTITKSFHLFSPFLILLLFYFLPTQIWFEIIKAILMNHEGFEPSTLRLKVVCSTNWANDSDSERGNWTLDTTGMNRKLLPTELSRFIQRN